MMGESSLWVIAIAGQPAKRTVAEDSTAIGILSKQLKTLFVDR